MRRLFFWIVACVLSLSAFAQHELHNLDIQVQLQPNGDAYITETRQMTVGSEGTECYIVVGNLNGSFVNDLSVKDETGRAYDYIGLWQINRSRDEKAGKCGIVQKDNGYELCWGIGAAGERTYVTSYVVTDLLRGYTESDGFNYMFVARDIQPYPKHVMLTITAADGTEINDSIANVWAFGYDGEVGFQDSCIVAESTEPFGSGYSMIVMAEFAKGIFTPEVQNTDSFATVKERAFEGSDYTMESNDSFDDWFERIIGWGVTIGCSLLILFGLIGWPIYWLWQKYQFNKDLQWYRELPFNGDLHKANDVLNVFKFAGKDHNKLLSALVAKLIADGGISVEPRTDSKGQVKPFFIIHELPEGAKRQPLLSKLHRIFKTAAGSDTVLEARELRDYMKNKANSSTTESFAKALHDSSMSIYSCKQQKDEVRKLLGLRKYLKEFSLLDERGLKEATLWKDYMVYATLFGISKQVIRDMRKINPEFFELDQVADQMVASMEVPAIYTVLHQGVSDAYISKLSKEYAASGGSSRSFGGGGHSSFGGGGGFSGGGHGGGIR